MVRRFIQFFAALAVLAGCTSHPEVQPANLRLATFNIRFDTAADGANAWPHRREPVAALMRFYAPDLFGMQEVTAGQLAQLKEDLPAYRFVGVGRDDGLSGGEFSPLAFRPDRFGLAGQGTFWLSPTPDVPSRGWDAALPRIATWAHLVDRDSGVRILAVNTHWDHAGLQARLESGRLIRDWIAGHRGPCEAVVLLGDLNAAPDEASYQALIAPGGDQLLDTMSITETPAFGPTGTFNAFDISRQPTGPIDHIFVSEGTRVVRYGVITQQDTARLPSDHYPVIADIAVSACPEP